MRLFSKIQPTKLICFAGCLFSVVFPQHSNAQISVIGWGDNTYGQITPPITAFDVTNISAGAYHSLALRPDGTVIAWGRGSEGQTNIPQDIGYVVAIAAGGFHNLALRDDSTVAAWGAGSSNYTGSYNFGQAIVPKGLSLVSAIAAGRQHSVALKFNGTVVAWGDNEYGQTNVPAGLSNVVAIAAGAYHSLALRLDGTIVAWGWNSHNQTNVPVGIGPVEIPSPYNLARPVPYLPNILVGGGFHSLALEPDGTIVGWGTNVSGAATPPAGLMNIYSIAAGYSHSLAVQSDGTVVAWGDNSYGQTSVPPGLVNVTAVAGGDAHSLALSSCLPLIKSVSINRSIQPDGILLTFCLTVQGSAPLSYSWFTNNNTSIPASTASECFSWLFSPTDEYGERPTDYYSGPYLLFNVINDCGRDFGGVFPAACAICLSRGSPNLLNSTNGSGAGPIISITNGLTLGANSKWFKFMSTNESGIITVSMEGSSNQPALGVFSGPISDPSRLIPVAYTTGSATRASRVNFFASSGTVYWVVADPNINNPILRVASGFEPRLLYDYTDSNGSFELSSTIAPAISYQLQAASGVYGSAANWKTLLLTNLSATSSFVHFRDTNASLLNHRFYRLVPP